MLLSVKQFTHYTLMVSCCYVCLFFLFHRCTRKCFDGMDDVIQADIISKLYSLESKNAQDTYLQSLIECHPVSRRRSRKEGNTPRSATFRYCVMVHATRKNVCKAAFMSLHGTTKKRVERLCKLLQRGLNPSDKRGYHPNPRAVAGEELQKIHDHIVSFPVKETHYGGKDITYLDARLTLKIMHSLFVELHPDSKITYKYYAKYFRDNFSYRFGRPQIDTCTTCEELGVKIKSPHLNEVAKRAAIAELLIHKRRSKKFYMKMKEIETRCKEVHVGAICIDFMQNLPLPHIPVQEMFYSRQLWVNVFNIHNMKTGLSRFYVYHEGVAKKGCNEVCSFLMDYVHEEVPSTVKEFYVFSDGCPGQNRNHAVVRYLLSLTDTKRFEKVFHYFPVRGHSYLPCDRQFAVVKRVVRKADRVYVPKDYVEMIVTSSNKGAYSVKMVDTLDIFDFQAWWPSFYKKTTLSLESASRRVPRNQKVQFAIASFSHFEFNSERQGTVVVSEMIDGLVKHTFLLKLPGVGQPTIRVLPAYPSGCVTIKKKKIEDIQKLLRHIPDEFMNFYREIIEWSTSE